MRFFRWWFRDTTPVDYVSMGSFAQGAAFQAMIIALAGGLYWVAAINVLLLIAGVVVEYRLGKRRALRILWIELEARL